MYWRRNYIYKARDIKKMKKISVIEDFRKNFSKYKGTNDFQISHYKAAKNIDELFDAAGFGVAMSASTLWDWKKLSSRGKILLGLQEKFFPKSFKKYLKTLNNVTTNCVILVLFEITKIHYEKKHRWGFKKMDQLNLFTDFNFKLFSESEYTKLFFRAITAYSVIMYYDTNERKELAKVGLEQLWKFLALLNNEKIELEAFEFKLFENIVKSYPKNEGAVDFVKLKMKNVYHDYIAPLEPKIFIDNYRRLSGRKQKD